MDRCFVGSQMVKVRPHTRKGDVYEGEYMKGMRHGEGTYTFADGEKYKGQWFQDQQHGQGVTTLLTAIVTMVFGIKTISKDRAQCITTMVTVCWQLGTR